SAAARLPRIHPTTTPTTRTAGMNRKCAEDIWVKSMSGPRGAAAERLHLAFDARQAAAHGPHVAEQQHPDQPVGDADEALRGNRLLLVDRRVDRDEGVLRRGLRRRLLLRREGRGGEQGDDDQKQSGNRFHEHHSSAARYSSSSCCRRFSSSVRIAISRLVNSRNATTQNQNAPRIPGTSVGITDVFGWRVRHTLTDQ